MTLMTETALLAKYGLLDVDFRPTNNDLPPSPGSEHPGDYGCDYGDELGPNDCRYCGKPGWRPEPFGGHLACYWCWMQICMGD